MIFIINNFRRNSDENFKKDENLLRRSFSEVQNQKRRSGTNSTVNAKEEIFRLKEKGKKGAFKFHSRNFF
jgi:hypothetical protein